MKTLYDVAIIGAGAVGCALARELSMCSLDILVIEAQDDVSMGATKANSGIVHGGYASKAGTLKAKFALAGNRLFPELAAALDFPYKQAPSLVLAFKDDDFEVLESLKRNGHENGVEGLSILNRRRTLEFCPVLNTGEVRGSLHCPNSGLVSPYEYAIALAENALANGAEILTDSPVTDLQKVGDTIAIEAGEREFRAQFVVNAAGAGGERIASMAGPAPFHIHLRKGQYIVMRRGSTADLNCIVFQPPSKMGKGVLVTPTTWENILIGPDAINVSDQKSADIDPEALALMIRTAERSISDLNMKNAIRVFSGNRSVGDRGDFIIEWSNPMPGLLHLAGIESPGLTSSPAIAKHALRMLSDAGLPVKPKAHILSQRRALVHLAPLGPAAKAARAAMLEPGNPERIVCRCEQVTEKTICDALKGPLSLRSAGAIKRRTRAGMGPCQGTYCAPHVRTLISQVNSMPASDILGPSRDRAVTIALLEEVRHIIAREDTT